MEFETVLCSRVADVVQAVAPFANLREKPGRFLRNEDVPGISTIHDPLRDIHTPTGHIPVGVNVPHPIHRACMNPHAES
ncbi:MAG TPA: hypothetical protein VE825_01680 [Terriglobales bacterium]|jgi:hypothetical protein|nr:hypothetical protein [Terriglobales bacterium]